MSAPAGPPLYKGEPLDGERGPGLGCFWIQVALLTFFLIFTPLTVMWSWDPFISGVLLILTLVLLLFTGQTIIFLLRLVASDRRSQRHPLDPNARKTVGQLEQESTATVATEPSPAGEAPGPDTIQIAETTHAIEAPEAPEAPDATETPDAPETPPRADRGGA